MRDYYIKSAFADKGSGHNEQFHDESMMNGWKLSDFGTLTIGAFQYDPYSEVPAFYHAQAFSEFVLR